MGQFFAIRVSWHAETHAHTLTVVEHWRSKPVVAVRILHFSKVLISAKPAASASSRLFFFYFSFVHLSASYVFFFFYGISFISSVYLCRFDSRTLRSTGQTRPPPPSSSPPPPLASPVHYAAAAVAASSLLSFPLFTNARARALTSARRRSVTSRAADAVPEWKQSHVDAMCDDVSRRPGEPSRTVAVGCWTSSGSRI